MRYVDVITIYPRDQLGCKPLARIDAYSRPLDRLIVRLPAVLLAVAVIGRFPVVRSVIGDFDDFVDQQFRLNPAGVVVHFAKRGKPRVDQPARHNSARRHFRVAANAIKRFPVHDALAQLACDRVRVFPSRAALARQPACVRWAREVRRRRDTARFRLPLWNVEK